MGSCEIVSEASPGHVPQWILYGIKEDRIRSDHSDAWTRIPISILDLCGILLTLSAVFGWLNRKTVLLPHAIGLLVMGVVASLVLVTLDAMLADHRASATLGKVLGQVDFSAVVMDGMLAFLIVAGALHVDVDQLRSHAVPVLVLAILGTLISMVIVGCGFWMIAQLSEHPVPLIWVLGTLISPTDPVAVMSTLKTVSIPAKLEVQLQGESLVDRTARRRQARVDQALQRRVPIADLRRGRDRATWSHYEPISDRIGLGRRRPGLL